MNPVLPLRRLIDRGSKLRLDESEAGSYAKHYAARSKSPELSAAALDGHTRDFVSALGNPPVTPRR